MLLDIFLKKKKKRLVCMVQLSKKSRQAICKTKSSNFLFGVNCSVVKKWLCLVIGNETIMLGKTFRCF